MQLNFNPGNFLFQASSSFTALLPGNVKSSSKSSPSPSAAANAGLAVELSFARNFAALDPTPVVYWDERMSTAAVQRALIANDVSRARRAEVIDQMAAAYILQGALDRLAGVARPPGAQSAP